jgi:putative transcriptional regulator
MTHVEDLLPEYATGALPDAVAVEVEAHLTRCTGCAASLRELEDIYAQLPLALPSPPPPPGLRARILRSLAGTTENRFESFVARVGALLDVAADKARDLLARIDDAGAWVDGPAATRLIHLAVGPRVAHANCGFVRVRAGQHFPLHRHLGTEHVLIVQGSLIDSSGRTLAPGDENVEGAGSEHAFTALPGVDLVYLVVLEVGFEFAGGSPGDV